MKKLIALIIILLVGVAANNAWQATGKKRFASTLKESAVNTKDVVLERYYTGTVLQTARISNETFKSWMDQLPIGSGILPYTRSKCWVPHHRIKFDATRENNVEICFTCNEIWTEATGRRRIPEDWRQLLRAMFVSCNISDVAPDWKEYGRFLDAMFEAEQAGADQPTTTPELKSEGKDKPQPESKVAPR